MKLHNNQKNIRLLALLSVSILNCFTVPTVCAKSSEVNLIYANAITAISEKNDPFRTMVIWANSMRDLLKTVKDGATRKKLRSRLLILSDHLSSLQTSKRLLNASLESQDPDEERAFQNVNRLKRDIENAINEVRQINATVGATVPNGQKLVNELEGVLSARLTNAIDIRSELLKGRKSNVANLRRDSREMIRQIERAKGLINAMIRTL